MSSLWRNVVLLEAPVRVTLVRLRGEGPPRVLPVHEQYPAAARLSGWSQASGDVVAFLDDRYRPGPDWLAAISATEVVGGPVLPGPDLSWSGQLFYVVEYGWQRRLAAGNIAYPRTRKPHGELDPGAGRLDDRMAVELVAAPSFLAFLRERYRYSREWAAGRLTPFRGMLRIALPLLLYFRVPWWRRPATFPGVFFAGIAMAAGEIAGSFRRRSVTLES